ncbi:MULTISPECIES: transposase family protein [unclassified Streptomyces]|uniref:transposase family protein n=1 Tax=unclassified Streptomyces TaxID=2593676 RepID=UPI0037F8ABDC
MLRAGTYRPRIQTTYAIRQHRVASATDLWGCLPPDQRTLVGLVSLRRHDTLARLAATLRISVGTAHAYTTAVVDRLADCAPGRDATSPRPSKPSTELRPPHGLRSSAATHD